MRNIGFSTGAVARGDYRAALALLRREGVRTVELSVLRRSELSALVDSFHAPSRFELADESAVTARLKAVTGYGIPVVVHPDTIYSGAVWRTFGASIYIENMDKRKPVGRTAGDLKSLFERFPEAGLCFDIGHARQVDPTMVEAYRILDQYGDRLKQVHIRRENPAGPQQSELVLNAKHRSEKGRCQSRRECQWEGGPIGTPHSGPT